MDHLHDANLLERALVDKANQSRVPITTNFELGDSKHPSLPLARAERKAI